MNGLKYNDYLRYSRFCGKKAAKIRRKLGLKYGTGSKYFNKEFDENELKSPKFAYFLLFQAEKNWAAVQAKKQEIAQLKVNSLPAADF